MTSMLGLCLVAVTLALERPASTTVHTKLRHSAHEGAHAFLRAHRKVGGSIPVATCGGTIDIDAPEDQQIRMEREHGMPCKFPFFYKGVQYNNCTNVDSPQPDVDWCRTEFPGEGEDPDGPIRWGICNYEGAGFCPSNPVDEGRDSANVAAVAKVEEQLLLLKRFFSWHYWKPIVLCSLTLLFFSEFVGPIMDKRVGGFYAHGLVFVLQMVSFFLVACIFNQPDAAASQHILALSTIMLIAAAFTTLGMILLTIRGVKKGSWAMALVDDVSEVMRPFGRAVVVFLLVYGTLEDVNTQWAGLAAFGGLFVFGIAMATTSIISDFLAYVFIRMNTWFTEGDLIYYNGELHKVVDIHWRFTQTMTFAHKCTQYIPNGRLGNAELINQSQDSGRMVVKNIPLPPNVSGTTLETIVVDIWALLKSYDGKKFKSIKGDEYDNQINVGSSSVLISDAGAASSAKELAQVTLTVKLKGLYSYSTPPPFTGDGEEPDWRERQWDWLGPWNAQQERVLIDVQKVLDKHLGTRR